MPEEQQNQQETIRLNGLLYRLEDLGEKEMALLSDIKKIEGEIRRVDLQRQIAGLAKTKLLEELSKRMEGLEVLENKEE